MEDELNEMERFERVLNDVTNDVPFFIDFLVNMCYDGFNPVEEAKRIIDEGK